MNSRNLADVKQFQPQIRLSNADSQNSFKNKRNKNQNSIGSSADSNIFNATIGTP